MAQRSPSARDAESAVPSVPFGYTERQRLSMIFRMALERYPVVVVTAPNGYGKTAFLAHELQDSVRPIAWIGMDDRFAAIPDVFVQAFFQAVERAVPGLADMSDCYRDVPASDLKEDDYAEAASAISKCAPDICIVLDGYESIESKAVDRLVNYLMEHLPDCARMVISTSRHSNLELGRLALQGHLFELKTADFAFTFAEATSLLNDELGLELSFSDIERINVHMDGWVAGLRMVEVALRRGMILDEALASGGELQRSISQYLANDIVNRLPQDIRTFLLESSIFETFCADLCNHSLHRDDSAQVISLLLERGLFVQSAGGFGWYRYANFFRACLKDLAAGQPMDEVTQRHARASVWFSNAGMTETALAHAIEAGDYVQVTRVLGGQFGSSMGRDGAARMDDLIRQLPENIVRKSRWANISAAVACEMRQCFVKEGTYVEAALSSLGNDASGKERELPGTEDVGGMAARNGAQNHQDATLAASLHILRMLHDYHDGKPQNVIELGKCLMESDRDFGQHGRCGILNVMGLAYWKLGETLHAQSCWQESANLATYIDWPYSICLNLFGVAHSHYTCGHFENAQETCERIFAISNQQAAPVLSSGYAHMLMAKIHYDRNELEQAANQIRTARRIAFSGKERVLAMNAEMALARVKLAQGDRKDAVERANRCLSEFCSDPQYRQSFDEAYTLMAQVWLLAGKPDLARGYLGQLAGLDVSLSFDEIQGNRVLAESVFGYDFRNVWMEALLFDYLFGLIQDGSTAGIMNWLDYVQARAGEHEMGLMVTKTLILKALCRQQEGDADGALRWIAEALQLAEQNGCCRTFADAGKPMEQLLQLAKRKQMGSRFADKVLALVADGKTETVHEDVKTEFGQKFTVREREIMTLLCQGCTNYEISKRLYLSLSTVKNHIHHIYTKLGVRNRAEAIVRINELETRR